MCQCPACLERGHFLLLSVISNNLLSSCQCAGRGSIWIPFSLSLLLLSPIFFLFFWGKKWRSAYKGPLFAISWHDWPSRAMRIIYIFANTLHPSLQALDNTIYILLKNFLLSVIGCVSNKLLADNWVKECNSLSSWVHFLITCHLYYCIYVSLVAILLYLIKRSSISLTDIILIQILRIPIERANVKEGTLWV